MPIIDPSSYKSQPIYLINGHFETIVPSVFYKVEGVKYSREKLELDDGDFLDLDWSCNGYDRLVILSHGLEGSSDRHYIKRSAKFFSERGWDVLAWNNRGCGGELNRLVRFYHHGTIDDLSTVVAHASKSNKYSTIVLIGFSMGGSMVSKYFSLNPNIPDEVKGGVCFSVSFDLHDTVDSLENTIPLYKKKFLNKLKNKLKEKQLLHPAIQDIDINQINTFEDYHQAFTIPHGGYKSMQDFYKDASCVNFISTLRKSMLVVNALNDPLLGKYCYPYGLAGQSDSLFLETPLHGGHLGFTIPREEYSYMEYRALSFINENFV